jgi:hypothetical protein
VGKLCLLPPPVKCGDPGVHCDNFLGRHPHLKYARFEWMGLLAVSTARAL